MSFPPPATDIAIHVRKAIPIYDEVKKRASTVAHIFPDRATVPKVLPGTLLFSRFPTDKQFLYIPVTKPWQKLISGSFFLCGRLVNGKLHFQDSPAIHSQHFKFVSMIENLLMKCRKFTLLIVFKRLNLCN